LPSLAKKKKEGQAVFLPDRRFVPVFPFDLADDFQYTSRLSPISESPGDHGKEPVMYYRIIIHTTFTRRILFMALIVISLAGLAGCTPPVWYHPDQKDPLNFQNDLRECNEETARYRTEMQGDAKKAVIKDRQKACMKTKGYGWGKVGDVPDDCFVYEDKE